MPRFRSILNCLMEYRCPFVFKTAGKCCMKFFYLSEFSSWVRTESSQGKDLDPGPPFGEAALDAVECHLSDGEGA